MVRRYASVIDRFLARLLITDRGPGIGRWSENSILIVGDRPTDANVNGLPFIHNQGCAPWLASAMNDADIDENDLYWINSTMPDGSPTNASFVSELKPKAIIALGRKAEEWCELNGLEFIKMSHPQYWLRFRRQRRYPLIALLIRLRQDQREAV